MGVGNLSWEIWFNPLNNEIFFKHFGDGLTYTKYKDGFSMYYGIDKPKERGCCYIGKL